MPATATYRDSTLGITQPCPDCAAECDEQSCHVCGYSFAPVEFPTPAATQKTHVHKADSYHTSLVGDRLCSLCGGEKVATDGCLRCSECGEASADTPPMELPTAAPPKLSARTPRPSTYKESIIESPDCRTCGAERIATPQGMRCPACDEMPVQTPKATVKQPKPEPVVIVPKCDVCHDPGTKAAPNLQYDPNATVSLMTGAVGDSKKWTTTFVCDNCGRNLGEPQYEQHDETSEKGTPVARQPSVPEKPSSAPADVEALGPAVVPTVQDAPLGTDAQPNTEPPAAQIGEPDERPAAKPTRRGKRGK